MAWDGTDQITRASRGGDRVDTSLDRAVANTHSGYSRLQSVKARRGDAFKTSDRVLAGRGIGSQGWPDHYFPSLVQVGSLGVDIISCAKEILRYRIQGLVVLRWLRRCCTRIIWGFGRGRV